MKVEEKKMELPILAVPWNKNSPTNTRLDHHPPKRCNKRGRVKT